MLPLQPDLRPAHPLSAWITPLLLVTAILLLGSWQQPRRHADRLLDNDHTIYLDHVSRAITTAERRIWLMVYVARLSDDGNGPVDELCRQLIAAGERGVDVQVILDRSDPNATWPGPDNSPVATMLREGGLTVHLDEIARRSHSKLLVIDDQAIVGSHNWTRSALLGNREHSIATWQMPVVTELATHFQAIVDELGSPE